MWAVWGKMEGVEGRRTYAHSSMLGWLYVKSELGATRMRTTKPMILKIGALDHVLASIEKGGLKGENTR